MEQTKEQRTKKEQRRIAKLYKDLPRERLEVTKKLIDRAAYMLVSLEDMEEQINEDGLIIEMPQGDYSICRAHPLLQSYNAMIKNFNATIKQLGEALPPVAAEAAGQALMKFVAKPAKPAAK
mgnify:CR=1 FL=1